jgi:uncharacterized protein YyaL (SSP411 family)
MLTATNKNPNSLIHETSPYLLQHAYNPVNWMPFGEKAFEIARRENKPVLISIGYSACHWCHVMEHESFEDVQVAELMNTHFINIKVDREERSDVDMLYMQAVQLMTGQGGWPLNCFVLPDGRPFYGGTYFNKSQWINILQNLSNVYASDPAKVEEYAGELTNGIKQSELISTGGKKKTTINKTILQEMVAKWKTRMDNENGGPNRAPKFPLPSNYRFLLRYAILEKDKALQGHVDLTLTKMAFGGICDQLHGGFSRYSTDMLWKVPHFEKMLYDNSQLVSLYCEAYTHTKNELYKETAIDTLHFIEQEWLTEEGAFYSAFDADSDGEEGKYYVWNELDLKDLLGKDYDLFSRYYEINDKGYWEHGNYILMRSENTAQLLLQFNLTREELREKIKSCKEILKQEVRSRIKPGLDDKTITSWNAMMCSAFAEAYLSFGDEKFRKTALRSCAFILESLSLPDGKLYRTYKNGVAKIDGFLDDYAFTIEALMNCYMITQDEMYLHKAKKMCELTLKEFHNPGSDLLFYTNNKASGLIAKITETSDNVIPASNSQVALNLFRLGTYFDKAEWISRAENMLANFAEEMKSYGAGYSHWACLALNLTYPFKEIAIVGNNVNEKLLELYKHGLTNTIFALHAEASDLPLVKNRYVAGKTLFYVCENKACRLPVASVEETVQQLV